MNNFCRKLVHNVLMAFRLRKVMMDLYQRIFGRDRYCKSRCNILRQGISDRFDIILWCLKWNLAIWMSGSVNELQIILKFDVFFGIFFCKELFDDFDEAELNLQRVIFYKWSLCFKYIFRIFFKSLVFTCSRFSLMYFWLTLTSCSIKFGSQFVLEILFSWKNSWI